MISIIACASGRIESFRQHLNALAHQPAAGGCEYCLATWGDDEEHSHELLKHQDCFADVHWVPVRPDIYWPLPIAYNAALAQATGDYVLIVGADVVVDGWLLRACQNLIAGWGKPDPAWVFSVTNSDGQEFIGPNRKVALPYVLMAPAVNVRAMKGWSEAFCNGTCFDDNDFALRLLMTGVTYRWYLLGLNNIHIKHTRYGGVGREERNVRNWAVWKQRLMGYQGPLWPIFWDDNAPLDVPEGDGTEQQAALRAAMLNQGYPWYGDYNIRR